MPRKHPRPLTVTEFFALELADGGIADAARECKLPYTTVHRLVNDAKSEPRASTLKPIEEWSRALPAAAKAGVFVSAVKTLGLRCWGTCRESAPRSAR